MQQAVTDDRLYDLLKSAYALQTEIRKKTDELRALKDKLYEISGVDSSERSKKLNVKEMTAKISFKEAIKWDQIGDFWESLHKMNRWGGNFKSIADTPHFEMHLAE